METVVVLLTRDLRVHDHPALAEAARSARHVVPLFVFDDALLQPPRVGANRRAFLLESLTDLRASLRSRGGELVLRRGDPVEEAMRVASDVGAEAIFVTEDVSRRAQGRQEELARRCKHARIALRTFDGVTVVPARALRPSSGGDHYRVFTPYWHAWLQRPLRRVVAAPRALSLPRGLATGRLPSRAAIGAVRMSPDLAAGGESVARRRWQSWRRRALRAYGERADDLAGHMTSRLSPYLHFGCLSVVEVVSAVRGDPAADGFVRQLCWRDFHHQVTAAFPDIDRRDYRPRGDRWRDDPDGLVAWKDGRTGFPIVDAGMRQLRAEGWIHNRARLVVASFLVKDLRIDWREGASHFLEWLVDGDVANNSGNWQWVAGTGNDTRPNRVLDPDRQARRHDPAGEYVRRYVPELAGLDGAVALRPWTLAPAERRRLDYPERLVDHDEARAEFLRRRG